MLYIRTSRLFLFVLSLQIFVWNEFDRKYVYAYDGSLQNVQMQAVLIFGLVSNLISTLPRVYYHIVSCRFRITMFSKIYWNHFALSKTIYIHIEIQTSFTNILSRTRLLVHAAFHHIYLHYLMVILQIFSNSLYSFRSNTKATNN